MYKFLIPLILFLMLACDNSNVSGNDTITDDSMLNKDTFIRKTFLDTNYRPFLKRNDSLIIYEHRALIINPSIPDTETVYDINYVDLKKRIYTQKDKDEANKHFEEKNFPEFKKEFASKAKVKSPEWLNKTLWAEVVKYNNEFYVLDIERSYLKFDGKFIFAYGQNGPGIDLGITGLEEASSNHYIFSLITGDPFNSKNQTRKAEMQVKYLDKNKNLLLVKTKGPEGHEETISAFVPFDSLGNYKHIHASFLLNNHAARPLYQIDFEKMKW